MKYFTMMLTLCLLLADASAQALRDPTRPLAGPLAGNAAANAASGSGSASAAAQLPQLQMVLTGGMRKVAVINGEMLQEGEHFRGMQIISIGPEAVVMKTRKGLRTLPLSIPVVKQAEQ